MQCLNKNLYGPRSCEVYSPVGETDMHQIDTHRVMKSQLRKGFGGGSV